MTPPYPGEEHLFDRIAIDFGSNLADNIKNTWKRYLDDCFIIWNQDILALEALHELLNNIDPDIKITIEGSQHDSSFLDICVTQEGESLSTDIYYKPMEHTNASISIHATQGTLNVRFHTI